MNFENGSGTTKNSYENVYTIMLICVGKWNETNKNIWMSCFTDNVTVTTVYHSRIRSRSANCRGIESRMKLHFFMCHPPKVSMRIERIEMKQCEYNRIVALIICLPKQFSQSREQFFILDAGIHIKNWRNSLHKLLLKYRYLRSVKIVNFEINFFHLKIYVCVTTNENFCYEINCTLVP